MTFSEVKIEQISQARSDSSTGVTSAVARASFSELKRQLFICVLLHDLGHGELEIFLCNVDTTLTECIHTSLHADALGFGTRATWHFLGNTAEVNATHKVHLARMDGQDIHTRVLIGVRELNLTVDTARTE